MRKLIVIAVLLWNCDALALDMVNLKFYPDNVAKQENAIEVAFYGKIYADSWWLDEVEAKKFIATPEENFIVHVFNKNKMEPSRNCWPCGRLMSSKKLKKHTAIRFL